MHKVGNRTYFMFGVFKLYLYAMRHFKFGQMLRSDPSQNTDVFKNIGVIETSPDSQPLSTQLTSRDVIKTTRRLLYVTSIA